jgi:Na+/H+ antiporter NhaA
VSVSAVRATGTGSAKRRKGGPPGERLAAALMLAGAVVAMVWANAPFGATYEEFWSLPVGLSVGGWSATFTVHSIVNEGLMTAFFFLVGLEVKRELTIGELTDRSRAVLPIAAAVAGLALPAAIFVLFNISSGEADAWGVVISTDTAFLLGALALIAPRYPSRLRIFLLTLAVVDDIGALLAIGVFYNSGLAPLPFVIAIALMVLLALVRFLRVGRGLSYFLLGGALWIALLLAGIHPTLAGVAVALLIPVFPPRRGDVERAAELTQAFRESPNPAYAAAVTRSLRDSLSINERVDQAWRPYISYGVLPIFAIANAGVHLDLQTIQDAVASPVAWGIVVALVVGKFVGITGATALLQAMGKGRLAPGLGLNRIAGGGALSGIGFTISLFLVPIAISDPETQNIARVAVLTASVLAFFAGWLLLVVGDRIWPPRPVGAKLMRPFDPERDHFRGSAQARLEIVEYGDFECPFCSRATGSIDTVLEHFGDRVRWVWRHFPLDAPHPHAQEAAQAAEAAALQGRFLDMAVTLFAHQDRLETTDLCDYAQELGLDAERFTEDFRSPRVLRRIQDDRLDAELMDLSGTPTFFVNGRRHIGPYDSASLIRALEAAPGAPAGGTPVAFGR